MIMGYGEAIHQKLMALESAQETARHVFRRALRNFFPDGLRVQVHEDFYIGQIAREGVIVGMEPDGRLRVALGESAVLRVVPWASLTPILPDKVRTT